MAAGLPCCLQFSGSTRVHTNTSTFSRPSNHLAQLSERWAHQNIGREVADRGSGAVRAQQGGVGAAGSGAQPRVQPCGKRGGFHEM